MITDLIPQRPPILMVDEAQPAQGHSVIASLKVEDTNWFYLDGQLLEAGIIEHMAQSAAAMMGILNSDEEPKEGYIGDIKDFTVTRLPKLGETITSTIAIAAQLDNITIVEAVSSIQDEQIATARIKVFLAE